MQHQIFSFTALMISMQELKTNMLEIAIVIKQSPLLGSLT